MAASWDALRGDTSGWPDRAFYLEAIRRHGEPVLDVGCGTGRLLVDYRSLGIDIDGVDVSAEMLALCREKAASAGLAVDLFERAMEDLDLPGRYRCIIVPSSSFQLLLEPAQAEAGMARLRDHLEPGGALVMPFMTLWWVGQPLAEEWSRESARPDGGGIIRRRARSRFDPSTGLEHTDDLYEVVVGDEVIATERHVRSPATRSYTQDEARQLYERHGFSPIELLGEFVWSPARDDERVFCVIGVRPV
jgi:SAM-dependent methyltransferase